MNKHLLLLLSSFIIASTAFAQYETVVVGTKTDGSELTAKCYTFQQRVENIQISTSNDYLCISFRETTKSGKYLKNKGEIGLYDTKSKELKWKQPFDYSATSTSCLSNGILTKNKETRLHC